MELSPEVSIFKELSGSHSDIFTRRGALRLDQVLTFSFVCIAVKTFIFHDLKFAALLQQPVTIFG
jgi:hypothetical protein